MATLSQLSYAVAVDRHRNFRRAAAACFVTQPTLSTQLIKLEDELGVTLFDRSRKPVIPTRDGEILLAQFRRVLAERDRIDELVDELRGKVAGPYRLGVIPTMAPTLLPRVVPGFVKAYPDVLLHIEELTTDEIIRRLDEETLDGGLLATPLDDPRITELPVAREPFLVYHSPGFSPPLDAEGRVALDSLPTSRLIVMRDGHCLRAQTLDLCQLGQATSERVGFELEAGSLSTLCAMVREGPFFTVLPKLSAHEMIAQGWGHLVKEIAGAVPFREIGLVTRRIANRRAVREALVAHAREALAGIECLRPTQDAPVRPRG